MESSELLRNHRKCTVGVGGEGGGSSPITTLSTFPRSALTARGLRESPQDNTVSLDRETFLFESRHSC